MTELKTSIPLVATDLQTVSDAIVALAEHVNALHAEANTLAFLIGVVAATPDPKAALDAFIEVCGTQPEYKHFIDSLRTGLDLGGYRPPDGGTHLKIVRGDKKAA